MKFKNIGKLLGIASISFIIAACSDVEDAPMPYTQDNIQKLTKEIKKAYKSLDMNELSKKNGSDVLIALDKEVFEEKLHYSYDKSIRAAHISLYQIPGVSPMYGMLPSLISGGWKAILTNPKRAYDNNFISKETYELLKIEKDMGYVKLGENYEELFDYIRKCQDKGNGLCLTDNLFDMIVKDNKKLDMYNIYDKFPVLTFAGTFIPEGETEPDNSFNVVGKMGVRFHLNEKGITLYKKLYEMMGKEVKVLFP